jgi:hypothetical protein
MQWVHDLAGAGNLQLGDVGIGQNQVNDAMQELHPNNQQNFQFNNQNNKWNNWDEAADNEDNMDV